MSTNMTPYDDGSRLEPKPWPISSDTDSGDFGKVDFTDDFGETVFTGWVQKTDAGYLLRIDEHQDVALAFETSSQRQEREAAMTQLSESLRAIAARHEKAVWFYDHGEPDSFDPGHFVFQDHAKNQCFAITERYIGTDESDPDRIPNSWEVDIYRELNSGKREPSATHRFGPAEVGTLIRLTNDWVSERAREHATQEALHTPTAAQHHHQAPAAAPTY